MTCANLKFQTFALKVLVLSVLFSGLVNANISLQQGQYGIPYQWQMRKTAFYDATQQQLFFGSIAANAGDKQVLSTIDGSALLNYTPAGLTPGGSIDANGYETRAVWDMNLVYQGGTSTVPWLVSIMANAAGTAPTQQMYAANLAPGSFSSFSFTAIKNASDVDSIPFKVCMAEREDVAVAAADKKVFVVAIAGSANDTTFNSVTSGGCFRVFKINSGGTGFTEIASAKLNVSSMPTGFGFTELRDMWWDSTLKRLFCAFTRTNETKVGICSLYFDESTAASPVLKFLNDVELLTAPASGNSLIPYVHKLRTFCSNPTDSAVSQNKYLILNGGLDANSYNRIYALPLINRSTTLNNVNVGRIDRKVNDSTVQTAHDSTWLDQTNDIAGLTSGLVSSSIIAARTVGGGPLPVSPSTPVTDIQISGLNVYVSVADDSGAECVFVSTAGIYHETSTATNSTITAGQNSKLVRWSPWKKIVDSEFNSPIVSFGIVESGSPKLVALLDSTKVLGRTTIPTFTTVPQTSFSSVSSTKLDLADLTTMWRSRQLGVYNSITNTFYAGSSVAGAGDNTLIAYSSSVGDKSMLTGQLVASNFLPLVYNSPIWTMAMHGTACVVVPHTEVGNTPSLGGKKMYFITYTPSSQQVVSLGQTTDADIKDIANTPLASRIVNLAVAKKDADTTLILAAIPDATRDDFSSGNNNCIRSFKYTNTSTGIVPDNTFVYDLRSGGAPLAAQAGQASVLSYRSLEDMFYDSIFNVVYLGFTKSADGTGSVIDPGLAFIGWSDDGTAPRSSGKLLEGNVDAATGFKHIFKLRTLHTRTGQTDPSTNRSYLVFNGTNYAGVATDGTGQSAAALNRIYCLPLVVSGANAGKIATSTTHATAAVLSSATWSETGNAAADYAKHVVGGGYLPTHARSVVTGMVTKGKAVFVSVANPQGVVGDRGIFVSQAITDSDEKLVGWTSWKKIGGGNENIAFLGYNSSTDRIFALNHDSSRVEEISWKSHAPVDSANVNYQNLVSMAKTLEADFPKDKHGMYTLQNIVISSNDNATKTHMMGAFGYDSVALAHLSKKVSGSVGTFKYPHKLETTRYKYFSGDSVLKTIQSLYCMAVPQRLPGWVFVGGYKGLAVLCDSATGRGWTALPASLSDSGTGIPITSKSWKQITDVVGPVYKIVVMNATDTTSLVICMTKNGLQAFIATEGKFKTASPDALGMFDASGIFSDSGEYMRDIALVGGKMFLVGTTKGLYLMEVNGSNTAFQGAPVQIMYNSKLLGPIGSIRVTHPAFATIDSSDPTGLKNKWINVDVLTARVIDDQSEHYKFKIKLDSNGVLESRTDLTLQRSFTNLQGKIFSSGGSNYYVLPGKHLTTGGAVSVFADDAAALSSPTKIIQNDDQIGSISEVAADGTRVVTAGGSVYVYKA